MACGCLKRDSGRNVEERVEPAKAPRRTLPTDQCIACAQKHYDEAWIAMNECGYSDANRRFVRGSLRAVVLHTYREWKEIGRLARECALLLQEGRDDEAHPLMERLGGMIDDEFYKVNPDARERIDELERRSNGHSDTVGQREQVRQ